MSNYVVVKRR